MLNTITIKCKQLKYFALYKICHLALGSINSKHLKLWQYRLLAINTNTDVDEKVFIFAWFLPYLVKRNMIACVGEFLWAEKKGNFFTSGCHLGAHLGSQHMPDFKDTMRGNISLIMLPTRSEMGFPLLPKIKFWG